MSRRKKKKKNVEAYDTPTLGLVYINNMVRGSPLTILYRACSTETAINLYMSYRAATAGEKQDSNNCWFRLDCASVAVAYLMMYREKTEESSTGNSIKKSVCTVTSVVCC